MTFQVLPRGIGLPAQVDQSPAVHVEGLSVRRGGRVVLRDVQTSLLSGRVTGLFGPSGSGKSTLMRSIAGVQAGVRGEITVLGSQPGRPAVR